MSALVISPGSWQSRPRPAPSNLPVLAIAPEWFTAALAVDLTMTVLPGYQFAPDKSLANLPFALITVTGAAVSYLPSSLI